LCLSLLQKRRRTFPTILCVHDPPEQLSLKPKAVVQRPIKSLVDGSFGERKRARCFGGKLGRKLVCGVHQTGRGHYAVHDTKLVSLFGAHALAREDEKLGAVAPDEAGESLCASEAWYNAQVDFRLAQLRGVGGNTHIPTQRQLAAAAQRIPVDRHDHRLGQQLQLSHDALAELGVVGPRLHAVQRGDLADVRARDKSLIAGAGQDYGTHTLVGCDLIYSRAQVFEQRSAQGIEFVRTVDGNGGDSVLGVGLKREVLVIGHVSPLGG
jgi:hypothetical protein